MPHPLCPRTSRKHTERTPRKDTVANKQVPRSLVPVEHMCYAGLDQELASCKCVAYVVEVLCTVCLLHFRAHSTRNGRCFLTLSCVLCLCKKSVAMLVLLIVTGSVRVCNLSRPTLSGTGHLGPPLAPLQPSCLVSRATAPPTHVSLTLNSPLYFRDSVSSSATA